MSQQLIFTNFVFEAIDDLIESINAPSVFVLVDDNTQQMVLPILQSQSKAVAAAKVINTPAGDTHKNLDALANIWNSLSNQGATRGSVIINVGGGMVTDLGGFAASTFKRGIKFINVPTTLLGAVDASVGGKTGINFNGLKNEIGVFNEAEAVIISTIFFTSLSMQEFLSGYAEMLKHGLLDSADTYAALLKYDVSSPVADPDALLRLVEQSVGVKSNVVEADPHEAGIRKSLNLGHTAGHAFESFAMKQGAPIPHGYAVAWGLIVELVLSHIKCGFPTDVLRQTVNFVKANYGTFAFTCKDYDDLLSIMSHDKKNPSPEQINFTLLSAPGEVHIDQYCTSDEIKNALDIYRDMMQ